MTADKTHVLSASKEQHITNEITFVITNEITFVIA